MPFIKIPSFKTGINPSARSRFDVQNLTATQKLTLTASRIFGFSIGGNQRSGGRVIREPMVGAKRSATYDVPLMNIAYMFPFIHNTSEQARKKMMLEKRKMRILMRGVKIGKKKGGEKISLMNVFEKKSEEQQQKQSQ